jgi:hypothetical protein
VAKKRKVSPRKPTKVARPGYGWKPDVPDRRDLLYGAVRPAPAQLPPTVDLRSLCSPVENQGGLNVCTRNALVGALEFLEYKNQVYFGDLSRLFICYNERALRHSVQSHDGVARRPRTAALTGPAA